MATFDPDQYFQSKIDSIRQARDNKLVEINDRASKFAAKVAMHEQSLAGKLGMDIGGLPADITNTAMATVNEVANIGPSLVSTVLEQNANTYPEWDSRHTEMKTKAESIKNALDMSSLVGVNTDTGKRQSGLGQRVVVDGGLSLLNSAISVPQGAVGLASLVSGGHAGKFLEEAGFRPEEAKAFINSLKSAEMQYASKNVHGAEGFWNTLSQIAENPSTVPEALVESLFPMLSGGLAGRGLMLLGNLAKGGLTTGTAAAIGEGAVMAGSSAENIRNQTKDGLLTPEQSLEAATTGVLGAAIARTGAKVSNKLGIGDIDEAIVKGTLGQSKRGAVMRTIGSGLLEGAEEATQSTEETILQNVALDKPWDEGVGNAAAIGAVTGFAMGAPMALADHANDKSKAKQSNQQRVAAVNAAAKTGDVSALIDPKSQSYDPVGAVAALSAHSRQEGTTDEVKQANLEKANNILDTLEKRQEMLKQVAETLSPEAQASNIEYLQQLEQSLAATDPADTTKIEQLQADIAEAKQVVDDSANAEEDLKKLNTQLDKLGTYIERATAHRDQLESYVKGVAEEVNVDEAVALADAKVDTTDSKAVEKSRAAVERVINLSMSAPDKVTREVVEQLVKNKNNSLTEDQRNYLRMFDAARVAENRLKDMGKVTDEVIYGTKQNIGLAQYRDRITKAISANKPIDAANQLDLLRKFAESHEGKAAAVKQAVALYQADGIKRRVQHANGKWQVQEGFFKSEEAREVNGGLNIGNAGAAKIAERIPKEAQAISRTYKAMQMAYALRGTTAPVAPVTTSATTAQATPSPVAAAAPVAQTQATPVQATKQPKRKKTEHEKKVAEIEREIRRVSKQSLSLWTTLKHSLNESTLYEIYGSDWKKRYTMLKGKDAGDLSTRVANGLLDPFLPLELREETNRNSDNRDWETEGVEEIKRRMREGMYLTQETYEMLQKLDYTLDDLLKQASFEEIEQEIENELNEDTQTTEAEQAQESQTNDNPADVRPVEGTAQEESTGDSADAATTKDERNGVEPAGTLEALKEDNADKPYVERNLLADQLTQVEKREGNITSRPLVAVKNFLSELVVKKSVKVSDFLPKDIKLTDAQKDAIRLLTKYAKDWFPAIKGNLVKGYWNAKEQVAKDNPKFNYKDLMQFLIQGTNESGLDLEENVKTALVYGAMRAIVEQAGKRFNDDSAINGILNRPAETEPTYEEKLLFGDIGVRENLWRNAAGKVVVEALGFKANQDAQADLIPRLETAFGGHIQKLLMDAGVIERMTLTAEEMASVGREDKVNEDGTVTEAWNFIRLIRNDKGELTDNAKNIVEKLKGTGNILDKMFSVQEAVRQPTLTPTPTNQSNAAGVSEGIPSNIKEAIAEKEQEQNFMRDDLWNLVSNLDPKIFLQMSGWTDMDNTVVHEADRISVEAKNEGLVREYNNLVDFVKDSLLKAGDLLAEVPFFFQYSVKKQQRVHIDNNGFNPQASKMHRWMFYKPSWKIEINMEGDRMLDLFKLRVAEGLGVKTDAQLNKTTLDKFDALFAPESPLNDSPEATAKATALRDGVEVLQKNLRTGEITEEDQQILLKAVKTGGEKVHSLSVLTEMAAYWNAIEDKKSSFPIQLQGEIDGKTNGIIISLMLFGGASSVEDMQERLRKGGFYFTNDAETQFNDWRSKGGNLDSYEALARLIYEKQQARILRSGHKVAATFDAVEFFLKPLVDVKGKVGKEGRDVTKNPLTTMMFGSSLYRATDRMADMMMEKIIKEITEAATGKSKHSLKDVLTKLNVLLEAGGVGMANVNMSATDALTTTFSVREIKAIKKAFHQSLGVAAKEAISEQYGEYLANRDLINQAATLVHSLSAAAISSVREDYIAELISEGTLPTHNGEPIRALTKKEEKELNKRTNKLVARLHTVSSKRDGKINNGVRIGKFERTISQNPIYQSTLHFGKRVAKNAFGKTTYAFEAASNELVDAAPGAGIPSKMVHSLDSATSHDTQMGREVVNNHDALNGGLAGFEDMGQGLNQNIWNNLLEYSPISEMLGTFTRTIQAIVELSLDSKNQRLSDTAKANLTKALNDMLDNTTGNTVEEALNGVITQLAEAAYAADKLKLETMAKVVSVDQYTLEGGNYLVTEKDQAKVAEKLAALTADVPLETREAIDTVVSMLEGLHQRKAVTTAAKETSVFGTLNKAYAAGADTDWQETFAKRGTLTAKQAFYLLRKKFPENTVKRAILEKLVPLINENLTIKLIDKASTEADVLEMPNGPSSAWYVSKDGNEAIYVLSALFAESQMNSDTLLHELLHAALAQTLRNPTRDAQALINELKDLLDEAKAIVKADPALSEFAPAVESVDELISWGMTNQNFQVKVLSKVRMESRTTGNKLLSGLKQFVESIARLLFRNPTKQQTNGINILVTNVTGLLNPAAKASDKQANVNQSMAANRMHTTDIFDALDDGTNSDAFKEHLSGLLSGIVESLHGPFGTFKELIAQNAAKTPSEVFFHAKATGVAPFASAALVAGFTVSEQEAFAMEQVEATVRASVSSKDSSVSSAYAEMERLYREARNQLKGLENSTNPEEKAIYEFVFTARNATNGRSDYLSRFAALGLAHKGFRKLLGFDTTIDKTTLGNVKGIIPKLNFIFNKILNFLNARLTHTYDGQRADLKLTTLVEQLVQIETRRVQALSRPQMPNFTEKLEETLGKKGEAVRNKLAEVGQTSFFQNNRFQTVKFAGNMVTMIGQDRAGELLDTIFKYRDRVTQGKYGIVMGVLNNVRGVNQSFQELLYATKHNEQHRKELITGTAKILLNSFKDGERFTNEDKKALTYTFLRTDMASLLGSFTTEDMSSLLKDPNKLAQTIKGLEQQLKQQFPDLALDFAQDAWHLGYWMITGEAKTPNLLRNAGNIARRFNTAQVSTLTEAQIKAAEKIIDQLTTLRALSYVSDVDKIKAARILATESARQEGNGVMMMLHTHLGLQQDARTNLFRESEALMIKGYLPEITNTNTDVKVVDDTKGHELELQGYKKIADLKTDPRDRSQFPKAIYALRDGGLKEYLTGIISLTSMQSRGSKMYAGNPRQQAKNQIVLPRVTALQDPARKQEKYAVPILNAQGKAVEYHYMMQASTRDSVLERDNRFEHLLGAFAGANMDKIESAKQNKKTMQALKDFYDTDIAEHPNSYLRVGPTSTDPELRELWQLLPDATKREAERVWGKEGILVRNDMLDLTFGYRKMSYLADLFERNDLNKVEEGLVWFMEQALFMYAHNGKHLSLADSEEYKKRAAIYARRAEKMWQEIVHEMKDIIVMKTGAVMIGNILSNVSLLMMNGVSFKDIVNSHRVAMKGAMDYKRDTAELYEMKHLLDTGQTNGKQREIEHKVMVLEDRIARNPVRELMEAGLMPTIVEDVAAEDDIYSYKSRFVRMTDKYTSKVNPTVLNVAKNVYMAHDTKLYQALSQVTQLSDFVARYTLFEHLTTKKDPLSARDAIKEAADSFINYDIPAHRTLQYLDDMGIFMFSKYFIRIQKVLLKLTREHPTRVLGMMLFDHYMNVLPLVTESSVLNHIGNNPFSAGALGYPTVLDDLLTVETGLSLFK